MHRTHNAGELNETNIGQEVKIAGWLENIRDLGALMFINVRDFYGTTQAVINDETMKEGVRKIPRESTISVMGKVVKRSSPNKNIPTGEIEIEPSKVEVLGLCTEALPFEVGSSVDSKEENRLKYRFLDLRNPVVKDKIVLRSKVIDAIRKKMKERKFLEIQTPILTSSSPEGARDYLVPSRVHPGKFYALPQAPQQFKQLLMVSGIDRYFQIAPCFRDEDARADRSPGEFYQLDLEMSFAEQEDVFLVMEEVMYELFTEFSRREVSKPPFRKIKYLDAIELYGSDKPDLRNPLLLSDLTDLFKNTAISFLTGKVIRAVYVENFGGTRKMIDEVHAKVCEVGGQGVAWVKLDEKGEFVGSIAKNLSDDEKRTLTQKYNLKPNGMVCMVAGIDYGLTSKLAGVMRNELGRCLNLIKPNAYEFCFIVDFPMYEKDEETGRIDFCHNPFSMPQGGLEALLTKDPLDIYAYQYDIVCNGTELSSGAVRNHDPKIMVKAFEIAGYPEEVVEKKFPALFNAFKYGAPPHAGIAPGVDRIVMLLADEPNIREVIAFPMNKNAQDLLMGAPNEVTDKQLSDVHIKIVDER